MLSPRVRLISKLFKIVLLALVDIKLLKKLTVVMFFPTDLMLDQFPLTFPEFLEFYVLLA